VARSGEEIRNPVAGLTLRFLRVAAETDGELLEMEATYEPSSIEPVEHFHPSQDEHFEILEGIMRAEVDGEQRELRLGNTLDVPAGTPHAMWNAEDRPARTRWQTRPALRTEEFFETVFRLAREGKTNEKGIPNPLQLAVVANAYRDEFRTTRPPQALQALLLPVVSAIGRLFGYRA
jgi:mannose-6-phosphate isomerase-like protein (cupin superfamily)